MKRKAEAEEERDDLSTLASVLPTKASPAAESPKVTEEKNSLGGEQPTSKILLCQRTRKYF